MLSALTTIKREKEKVGRTTSTGYKYRIMTGLVLLMVGGGDGSLMHEE